MIYAFAATAIAAALVAGAGTWRVQSWRYASMEKERIEAQAEKERNDRKVIDVAATGHEKDRAAIRTEFVTRTNTVEKIVREPFYVTSELCLDPDGLRELAAAVRPQPAPGVATPAVPGPQPAD